MFIFHQKYSNIFFDYTNIEEKREQMLLDCKGIDQEYKYEYNRINAPVYLACEYNKFLEIVKWNKQSSTVNSE